MKREHDDKSWNRNNTLLGDVSPALKLEALTAAEKHVFQTADKIIKNKGQRTIAKHRLDEYLEYITVRDPQTPIPATHRFSKGYIIGSAN